MKTLTLIGAGNVAWHLAQAFCAKGIIVRQVWSRTFETAAQLADKVNAVPVDDLGKVDQNSDAYLISVHDDAIPDLASKLVLPEKLVLHTSGSVSLNVLKPISRRIGVLYPLQTFSKQMPLNVSGIPFYIETAEDSDLPEVRDLALLLSGEVAEADSSKRQQIHLAAVFANNFSNYMLTLAGDILQAQGLDFEMLRPLIAETFRKIERQRPEAAQTGPAKRGDKTVIEKHLQLLAQRPDDQNLYQTISALIEKRYRQ